MCSTERLVSLSASFNFQEMIDEADKDGDGEVSEAEFLRIMKKTNMYWNSPTIDTLPPPALYTCI